MFLFAGCSWYRCHHDAIFAIASTMSFSPSPAFANNSNKNAKIEKEKQQKWFNPLSPFPTRLHTKRITRIMNFIRDLKGDGSNCSRDGGRNRNANVIYPVLIKSNSMMSRLCFSFSLKLARIPGKAAVSSMLCLRMNLCVADNVPLEGYAEREDSSDDVEDSVAQRCMAVLSPDRFENMLGLSFKALVDNFKQFVVDLFRTHIIQQQRRSTSNNLQRVFLLQQQHDPQVGQRLVFLAFYRRHVVSVSLERGKNDDEEGRRLRSRVFNTTLVVNMHRERYVEYSNEVARMRLPILESGGPNFLVHEMRTLVSATEEAAAACSSLGVGDLGASFETLSATATGMFQFDPLFTATGVNSKDFLQGVVRPLLRELYSTVEKRGGGYVFSAEPECCFLSHMDEEEAWLDPAILLTSFASRR